MIHKCNDSSISQAAELLRNGRVVAIPTDTLYGLSANAFDAEAIEKIYDIKHRPHTKPMIVLVSSINDINDLAHYDERLEKLAKAFWPGPLTVLLNRIKDEHKLDKACLGLPACTFRVPNCEIDIKIIKQLGSPIVSTTANISGEPNPMNAQEIHAQLGDSVEFILDNGPSPETTSSTIVDLTSHNWKILRPGVISEQKIKKILD